MTVEELNVKITADVADLKKDLAKMEKAIKGSSKKSEASMSGAMKKIGGAVAGAFAVQGIISFSQKIIEVRSEFERFEAVLTNTLGSSGEARLALLDIKEMASRTPFSVAQLSDSFVKLTNYGLMPTMEAMRQYGDLASAVGKDFGQLAEAVADATTGEFERLKEFGIRASKEGDKVTFIFKEQATEVDFSAKAIEGYIKSLGDLEGVAGSMESQMETLGGAVSNFGDTYANLLVTLGDSTLWNSSIGFLSDFIETLDVFINTWDSLPTGELRFWTDNEYSVKQLEKAQKDYNEQLRISAQTQITMQERMGLGLPSVGPLTPEQQGAFKFAPTQVEPEAPELSKQEIKARKKAKEEMIDFANAMNLVTRKLEGVALPTEVERAESRRRFQMFEETGQLDLAGMLNVGFEEEEGIPAFEDAKVYLADTNEAMFDFGSSASILSQSLLASAQDTQAAGDIFASAIGAIVSELLTQALATKMGSFAGPLGGLVGGFLTLGLKGADMETSRVRTQNSTARFN